MRNFEPNQDSRKAARLDVGALFSATAKSFPNAIAVSEGDRKITYHELNHRTDLLACALRTKGLRVGDRVAVLLKNCTEFLELELACAKLGVIVAALNWRLGPRELHHCVELVAPKLCLTQSDLAANLSGLDIPQILIGNDYESLISEIDASLEFEYIDPEAGLVILYTSGTTGLPKGALISHRAMIARSQFFAAQLQLRPHENFIAWAPLFHMASTDHSLATLMRGGTVFVVDGYRPDDLINILRENTVGWFVAMPGMVGNFATACRNKQLKAKGITAVGAMADLVPKPELAAITTALNAPYLNTFGATETGLPPATGNTIAIGKEPASMSKVQSSFCTIRLVDPADNDVPDGEPGEVAMRGATLFSGYWKADETNVHDFRNGWFHMGDVMRRNEDGTLDYIDRLKYMIKSGGENIYPAEIEQVLSAHPRIKEAVVVRKPHKKWGEVPIVFVVADDDVTKEDVLAICADNLSAFKKPKAVYFIKDKDLPRSTTGKIQRHELENRV